MDAGNDDVLLISGIQHFVFCRRQWALIHLEQQWTENIHTIEGDLFHERSHDESASEKRGDVIIARGMEVFSRTLGLTGKCDVVEFHPDPGGVPISGRKGRYLPYPIEYKKGRPKPHDADEMQLCAQALCLEEMFVCDIPEGSLFYGEPHRRHAVPFTSDLRRAVADIAQEMCMLMARGHTPRVKTSKACASCSLRETCLPGLMPQKASTYIDEHLKEAQSCER